LEYDDCWEVLDEGAGDEKLDVENKDCVEGVVNWADKTPIAVWATGLELVVCKKLSLGVALLCSPSLACSWMTDTMNRQ